MWTKSYTELFENVNKEKIWQIWADVNNWHKWDPDIEYAKIEGSFEVGSSLMFKPKKGPSVKLKLVEVVPGTKFTDLYTLPGVKMWGVHEMVEEGKGVRLTTTMKVTGLFGFLWRKLVAEAIVKTLPEQMHSIIKLAKSDE